MTSSHDTRCPGIWKREIARLHIMSYGMDYYRELSITLVERGYSGGPADYQLRCRCQTLHGSGRHWVRPVSQDHIQPALEALRGSMVPAMPAGFHLETRDVTELTFYNDSGYQVSYSWGFRPPRDYESLARFSNAAAVGLCA